VFEKEELLFWLGIFHPRLLCPSRK